MYFWALVFILYPIIVLQLTKNEKKCLLYNTIKGTPKLKLNAVLEQMHFLTLHAPYAANTGLLSVCMWQKSFARAQIANEQSINELFGLIQPQPLFEARQPLELCRYIVQTIHQQLQPFGLQGVHLSVRWCITCLITCTQRTVEEVLKWGHVEWNGMEMCLL